MFQAIVFTVLDCGFVPRCSLEISDATEFRLRAIFQLIKKCKYGIHDLCRVERDATTNLPRFNMPFELGVFYGAKVFGGDRDRSKNCIVLEKQRYRYHKFISDLSGSDIIGHNDSPKKAIVAIRNWLATSSRRRTLPDGPRIFSRQKRFRIDFQEACESRGVDSDNMPFVELTRNMADWLKLNQEVPRQLFARDRVVSGN